MREARCLAVAVFVGVFGVSLAAQEPPVSVFVTTPSEAQGFTDPSKERQDSVKDLKQKIQKANRLLKLVDTSEDATIILELLDREQEYKHTTSSMLLGGPWGKARKRSVTVRLRVDEYSSELTSEKGSYKDAAADVVKQLQKWVVANRAKLSTTEHSQPK